MKILAFDTSTKFLTIALMEDKNVVSEFHQDMGIRHSEVLVSTIGDLLEKAGWKLKGIDLICVGLGPGSFTGLRIGIACVKGFCAAVDCKVVGVPTLDVIALNGPENKEKTAPLLDAHKKRVYTCIYDNKIRIGDYRLLEVDELLKGLKEKVFFFGNAIEKYHQSLDESPLAEYKKDIDWYPRARDIGLVGLEMSDKEASDPNTIEPLYLYPKECNITQSKGMK